MVLATPVALFDPQRTGPSADAVDIQLRMPRSMQVWVDDLARSGQRHQLADVEGILERLARELVQTVQRSCGKVEGDWPYADAQIAVTPISAGGRCDLPPGSAELRPHIHMYLGATGRRLRDDARVPILFDKVRNGAYGPVWGDFFDGLRRASREFGHRWDHVGDGAIEIVDPPYAERGQAAGFVTCPGFWGPRRLIMADEDWLAAGAASEQRLRAQQAAGITWSPVTVDGRPPPPPDHDERAG